ncbi:MAG: bifunctional diaminohydroxyphosphoribosylaminopyrimidine deaminase/5-amino-6-(5-phosphoribosylamino)uracil reductase RibD [Candidatus Omnitrophica bacterium]|nr:bifunctional diaminohydroxyphosphoribosylaminopyrimidine deaminase/5-amino-6-(5-phosphoribosylamino)uracil reductase RibD [Candidatus Omnitrophota bacterium]
MSWSREDIRYMEMALKLAGEAKERTYPNPMVGAVLVKNGEVIGKGFHSRAGEAHAEIKAIEDCAEGCEGATMYVTLEPCDHHGRTPPCSIAVLNSGIREVFVGMNDPNPLTSGKGLRRLRKAGLTVRAGLLAERSAELNRKYVKFITTGMPYLTVKLAQSIDGKIAARDGSSQWISSEASRRMAKESRGRFDAIMVGANTVENDDPGLLDPRGNGYDTTRVVVDSSLRISRDSRLFRTLSKAPLLIGTTEKAPEKRLAEYRAVPGVDIIRTRSRGGRVSLEPFLRKMASRGMVNVLVEGGGQLAGALFDQGLVDEVMIFVSPCILGGPYSSIKGRGVPRIGDAVKLDGLTVDRSGADLLISGKVRH